MRGANTVEHGKKNGDDASSDPSGRNEKKGRGSTRKDRAGPTMKSKTGRYYIQNAHENQIGSDLVDGIQAHVRHHQPICSKS